MFSFAACLCAADRSTTDHTVDNITETPNATDSKFDKNVTRHSPDMKPLKSLQKGGRGHATPQISGRWMLSSKTVKKTPNSKFQRGRVAGTVPAWNV